MNEYSLTPVQEVDGLRIKRDDLYAPFGPGEVNGGKLRQCVMLVNSVKKDYKSLLTYCSIHSPQAPITAAVARANGMPCRIVYGGTTRESVAALPMPRLAMKYGASIVLAARSGRHSILHARAKELAAQENSFIVQYGINIIGYGDTLLTAVAAQTENLPDDIENLVMTCGSGITATGVMIGLHRYGKRVKRMHPSRGPRKGSRGHPQRSAGADCGHHQQALRLRRTEMARNSVCKTAILFVFGGLAYFGLEVLFRGHSHWTMFALGGFLFLILGELNEGLLEWDTPLILQGIIGSAIVTGAELATGMILNVWLGLGVWDYSGMPLNYKGQICLPFSILWIFVSIAAVVLDDWLRYWLFGEERPHYTLFRRGESR